MYVVATLAEGKYLEGALVLFNSLVALGFKGRFVIGVRCHECLSTRIQANIDRYNYLREYSDRQLRLIRVQTDLHFTNYKPQFMMSILDTSPECKILAYLDPDIVCLRDLNWILTSAMHGPVVAADVNWQVPRHHPLRIAWINLINEIGHQQMQCFDMYFNGGMLVVSREDSLLLDIWQDFLVTFGSTGARLDACGEISTWRKSSRANPMFAPDQDALNMALMTWPRQVCTFGPDMMGFTQGDTCLPHAIGGTKPWNKKILLDALRGMPPRLVDKSYWNHCDVPIRVYSKRWILMKRIQINVASFIGRFYRRI